MQEIKQIQWIIDEEFEITLKSEVVEHKFLLEQRHHDVLINVI